MKESMNVAKTLAWSLLDTEIQTRHLESFDKVKIMDYIYMFQKVLLQKMVLLLEQQ